MFKKKSKYNIAIVGATGIVGESLLDIINEKNFPIDNIVPLASHRSVGSNVKFGKELITVKDLATYDFKDIDIAFFSAGAEVSQQYVPIATKAGAVVIDNTSQFRYQEDIPLVVPEVNKEAIDSHTNHSIIANPNCSTIQMLVALKPVHERFKIKNINVSTYQAVSGSGKKGIQELLEQTHSYLNQREISKSVYPSQIAFNVIPFVDSFLDNGYTKEEMKMVWETQKILDKNISVDATAVRVPVLIGHSESISIETEKVIDIDTVVNDYKANDKIELIDDSANFEFPTAVEHGNGTDKVFVGRIRKSQISDKILNIWVVADNVRKGAALNSIQIAELLTQG